MKTLSKIINKENLNNISHQFSNTIIEFFHKLEEISVDLFKKLNNQLNIYSELKRTYTFPQIKEEHLTYVVITNNGLHKSIERLLIVSKQNDNQFNYFNC